MITEEQFAAIKRLIVSEKCMIDRFEHYVSEIKRAAAKGRYAKAYSGFEKSAFRVAHKSGG